ncbi:nucleoporin Nup186/Nup192/Nup205 [Paraphysoderma sedebokerense]|nr:nucleoporin Nup186/Nup192/Nup205 [Paraphysoderma sedebokerense]
MSSTPNIEFYYPVFEPLNTLILESCQLDQNSQTVKQMMHELELRRDEFLTLLDEAPKDAQKRKTLIDGGAVTINGQQYNVTPAFRQAACMLSDYLDIHEEKAAALIHVGKSLKARFGRETIEVAVSIYHAERIHLLACLDSIITGMIEAADDEVKEFFAKYMDSLIKSQSQSAVGNITYVTKIVNTIEKLKKNILSLKESMPALNVANMSASIAGPNPSTMIGEQINTERIESLTKQRKMLALILIGISYHLQLSGEELLGLGKNVMEAESTDPTTIYLLYALLCSLDTSPDHHLSFGIADSTGSIYSDHAFIDKFQKEIFQSSWKGQGLRAVSMLQWSLFLSEALEKNSTVQNVGVTVATIENLARKAINEDAFKYLIHVVTAVKQNAESRDVLASTKTITESSTSSANNPLGGNVTENQTSNIIDLSEFAKESIDFKTEFYILNQTSHIIFGFINRMNLIVRDLKSKEEDAFIVFQHQQASLSRPPIFPPSHTPTTAPRHDFETLLYLIAVLCYDSPKLAIQFWHPRDGKMFLFVRWAADVRTKSCKKAYYNMLAALATGPQAAQSAFDYLSSSPVTGGFHGAAALTWNTIFDSLKHYVALFQELPGRRGTVGVADEYMEPMEAEILTSLLRLLRQVVFHSPIARAAIYENPSFETLYTLFSLLTCQVPVTLKAALLDTIAAFASSDDTTSIALAVWSYMEQVQIVPTVRSQHGYLQTSGSLQRPLQSGTIGLPHGMSNTGSIRADLEELESRNETYPETLGFIHLLNSLIHIPKSPEFQFLRSSSVPDNLGSGYRTPGVKPYIDFVIDSVFLKADGRGYLFPEEKWRIISECLKLFEKCLITFDLSKLVVDESGSLTMMGSDGRSSNVPGTPPSVKAGANLQAMTLHPGFEVMTRMLSGSKMLETVLKIFHYGLELTNDNPVNLSDHPFLTKSVLLAQRLLFRIMKLQNLFIDFLLPSLAEFANGSLQVSIPPNISHIDQLLLYRNYVVIQIARYISVIGEPEIPLLSVKILSYLSLSSYFGKDSDAGGNRLVHLLESSEYSNQIMHGFLDKLDQDEISEDMTLREAGADDYALQKLLHAGSSLLDMDEKYLNQYALHGSVRSAIVDMFLRNLRSNRLPPTVAHFFLGFDMRIPPSQIQIPVEASTDNFSCLQILTKLLNTGVKYDQEEDSAAVPFYQGDPLVAEKCYHLMYILASDRNTFSATLRYLRHARIDFIYSHFQSMHSHVFTDTNEFSDLVSFLHQRNWLLRMLAVELRITAINGQRSYVQRMLDLLYSTNNITIPTSTNILDEMDMIQNQALGSQRQLEQSLMRMQELLSDFLQIHSLLPPVQPPKSVYFSHVSLSGCQHRVETHCVIYDVRAVYEVLLSHQRNLERQGSIATPQQREIIKSEIISYLEYVISQNRLIEIIQAQTRCIQAWGQVVGVTLANCFELVGDDYREPLMSNLLTSIVPALSNDSLHILVKEELVHVALALITKLREDSANKVGPQVLNPDETWTNNVNLAPDTLHSILRYVIDAIIEPSSSLILRGNLYTFLHNYLQYTSPSTTAPHVTSIAETQMANQADSFVSIVPQASQLLALQVGNVSIIRNVGGEQLLEIICRDACDGMDVWKTVSFTLLDKLCQMIKTEKVNWVVEFMVRKNYLNHWIGVLRKMNANLIEAVTVEDPEIEAINDMYIYEAMIALFVQISQRRDGAVNMLEAGVVECLADCEFLDVRPDLEGNAMQVDYEGFLPPATQRYHQLLTPALQLLVGILSSTGRDNATATKRLSSFVIAHSETLVTILKDRVPKVTISGLTELQLVTSIFSFLSGNRAILKDMNIGTSIGSFHNLLLLLFSKYSVRDSWWKSLAPTTEAEKLQAETISAGGLSTVSMLQAEAQYYVHGICRNVLSYCQTVTEGSGETNTAIFQPVFVWSLAAAKDGDYHLISGTSNPPSLGLLVVYLKDNIQAVTDLLSKQKNVSYRLQHVETLSIEDIRDILAHSQWSDEVLEGLSYIQRQQLALKELKKTQIDLARELGSSLFIIEAGLILLFRHLDFYLGKYNPSSRESHSFEAPKVRGGKRVSNTTAAWNKLFQPGSEDVETIRSDAVQVVIPMLKKVGLIELTKENVGISYRSRSSFVQMLSRKIRDMLLRGQEIFA